jgi:hypothetical protein
MTGDGSERARAAFPDLRALLPAVFAVVALPAIAQLSTETAPSGRTVPSAEQVERDMATARIRLGPLRLLPFFALRNVGWTNNALVTSEGETDDYTASVSVGTAFVVPFGQKLFVRGAAAPSYDWYYNTEELRAFGGTYSGEVLGLFNRVTMSAGGGYSERIAGTTSEVSRDVLTTTTNGFAKAEVEILKRLSVFGGAEVYSPKQEDTAPATPGMAPVGDLDRTARALRAGVRYNFSTTLSLGLLGERTQTRFDVNSELRDFDTQAVLFVTRYDRERFYVEGTVGVREGKPVAASYLFPEFRTGTYGYFVSYFLSRRLELQVLGEKRPVVSLFLDNPYYFETSNGLNVRLAVGRRLSFSVRAEVGSNKYANPVLVVDTGEVVVRRDDTTHYGGGFDLKVSRAVTVGLTVWKDRWDSNIGFYDRETTRLVGGLNVSADFSREGRR